jgi:hypothetical protein
MTRSYAQSPRDVKRTRAHPARPWPRIEQQQWLRVHREGQRGCSPSMKGALRGARPTPGAL